MCVIQGGRLAYVLATFSTTLPAALIGTSKCSRAHSTRDPLRDLRPSSRGVPVNQITSDPRDPPHHSPSHYTTNSTRRRSAAPAREPRLAAFVQSQLGRSSGQLDQTTSDPRHPSHHSPNHYTTDPHRQRSAVPALKISRPVCPSIRKQTAAKTGY